MSIVYLSVGLPGSGKSTHAKMIAEKNEQVVIICRDAFRTMIKGCDYVFNLRFEPFIKDATNRAIESALEYGFDIIIDETHIKKSRREEIINLVRNYESKFRIIDDDFGKIKIIGWWFTESKRNLEFRMKESRGYESQKWEEIIEGMKSSFEEPTIDEGYDEIITINY